jgi:ribosomal protein S3
MEKLTREQLEAAKLLSEFYLKKNGGNYAAANEEIRNLRIFDIRTTDTHLVIRLGQPGLFIGRKGENIKNLHALVSTILGLELRVEEEKILWEDVLYCYSPDEIDY